MAFVMLSTPFVAQPSLDHRDGRVSIRHNYRAPRHSSQQPNPHGVRAQIAVRLYSENAAASALTMSSIMLCH